MLELLSRLLGKKQVTAQPKERNISQVINQILKEVPPGEEFNTLRKELGDIREASFFTAPELMKIRWQDLSNTLRRELGESPDSQWKMRISKIIQND